MLTQRLRFSSNVDSSGSTVSVTGIDLPVRLPPFPSIQERQGEVVQCSFRMDCSLQRRFPFDNILFCSGDIRDLSPNCRPKNIKIGQNSFLQGEREAPPKFLTHKQAVVRKHNKPRPRVAHRGIGRFLGIDQQCN